MISIGLSDSIATLLLVISIATLCTALGLAFRCPVSAPVSSAGQSHRATGTTGPISLTSAKWRRAPNLARQRLTLLRMVSAKSSVSTDTAKSGFTHLLGSMTFIKSVLDEADASRGKGGPYVALGEDPTLQLNSKKIQKLKRLTANLPLGIPLQNYELSSRFGSRVDPINHEPAFHPGLDMEAPSGSDVYSTGAGRVTFTGSMGTYGTVIEIDHGYGVVTRYAHLHRILVAKGQNVQSHSVIGEVGSTGRSTGPHLHYEIRIGGAAADPLEFITLGDAASQLLGTIASDERALYPRGANFPDGSRPTPIQQDISGFEF